MKFIKLLLILVLGSNTPAFAKLLQIVHTNDLHSFFDGLRSGKGGYAKVKTVIDQLKAEASAKGIPTLVLDAGDFGEGSSFYFSDRGRASLRALDLLGIDVTVLGNHDFILGGKELADQIKDSGVKAKILSANLKGKRRMGLHKLMPDYVDYDIDGMKVRIMGLTTTEIHFQYPLRPHGFISSSHKKGIKIAEKSQRDGVDYLIALTHTGLNKDTLLASHSMSIGLVVGGHTHVRLQQPKMVQNLKGADVPILQAGAHGLAVGSLLVDLHGDFESTIIDYKLYDIDASVAADENMKQFVQEAYIAREKYFNRSWDELIGQTEVIFGGYVDGQLNKDPSGCWPRHVAKITRKSAKSDLGMHFDQFQGEQIPIGPIRYGDIVDNYPHFRAWGDQGWVVARARMKGFILKQLIKLFSSGEDPVTVTIDGLKVRNNEKSLKPFNLKLDDPELALVGGEEIQNWKNYTVAFPSEISFAVGKLSKTVQNILFRDLEYTDKSYWPLLENYIRENSPISCSSEESELISSK